MKEINSCSDRKRDGTIYMLISHPHSNPRNKFQKCLLRNLQLLRSSCIILLTKQFGEFRTCSTLLQVLDTAANLPGPSQEMQRKSEKALQNKTGYLKAVILWHLTHMYFA